VATQINYIASATDTFLDLQSGLARPFWEVNITVSGVSDTYSGTLGQTYGEKDSFTKLLIHFDGADGSKADYTAETEQIVSMGTTLVNDAQLDTAQKVFGSASLLLDGTDDYVTLADSADYALGTGDFTISFRAMIHNVTKEQILFAHRRAVIDDSEEEGSYVSDLADFGGAINKIKFWWKDAGV